MAPEIVGREGPLTGQRFAIGLGPLTLGRNADNNVMIASPQASRVHAEVRRAPDGGCVILDRGSSNGTMVNGERVAAQRLRQGDLIEVGDEQFRFEESDLSETVLGLPPVPPLAPVRPDVLRVTVAGGGPVGLSLALLLDRLMGARVAVTVYDGRWMRDGDRVV